MAVRLSDEIIGDKAGLERFIEFCEEEAVRAEREACAKIAERFVDLEDDTEGSNETAGLIAAAIRARGGTREEP